MSKKALIIWKADDFAGTLRAKLGANLVITSEDVLLSADFDQYSGVVVLAELNWERRRSSDLFGIDVAKTLRAKLKLKLPVLFVSFLSAKQIRLDSSGKEILDRRIVATVGHDWLILPSTPNQWADKLKDMQPLTPLQFADVCNNFCNIKGLISETIHQLKNQYRGWLLKPVSDRRRQLREPVVKAFAEIVDLVGPTPEAAVTRDGLLGEIDFDSVDERAMESFLTRSEERFKLLVTEDDDVGKRATANFEPLSWKVLLLDDEPDSLTSIREELKARGITCEVARTVAEAEKFITNDEFNEVVVVISDYRLLELQDGIEKHQRKQGYDFLFELAEQNRLTHLIALSGLSRKFLLESFQRYNTHVEVYSKQDLIERGAVNMFADAVIDRGRETYDALCSRPLVGDWPALKPFYAAHRQAANYRQIETEINNRAKRFIIHYQSLLDSHEEAVLLLPGIEVLENLSAKMKNKNPQLHPESVRAFQNKLVGRRIALWLRIQLGYDSEQLLAALRGHLTPASYLGWLIQSGRASDETEAKTGFAQDIKSFITTGLCLAFPNPYEYILIEEERWLATEIGNTDWRRLLGVERQISYLVNIYVEMFFESCPELLKQMKERSTDVSKSGWPVIIGMRSAKDVLVTIGEIVSTPAQRKARKDLHVAIEKSVETRLKKAARIDEFIAWLRAL